MDDTDELILAARLKEKGWPNNNLRFSEVPDPLFTMPVYYYSTYHGAGVTGLDISHETLNLYVKAVSENPDLKDDDDAAACFIEAMAAFRFCPDSSPDKGILWEHLSRCTTGYVFSSYEWREINRIKREHNDDRHIHFFIVYDDASGQLGKTAMLSPQALLPIVFVEQFAQQGLASMPR